jgi:hypothetical protein
MNRRLVWRILLLASLFVIVGGLVVFGRRHFPILAAILFLVAVRLAHPVLDRNVSLLSPDLWKSPRIFFALAVLALAALFLFGQQDLLRRLL